MTKKKSKSNFAVYEQLSRGDRQIVDSLEAAAGEVASVMETGSGNAVGKAEVACDKARGRLARLILRLRKAADPPVARVIINLSGGIVQDACYDGIHPITVVVVDWDVEGGETDQLQVNNQWCWVYHTQVDAYDPKNLTDIAEAADLYAERCRYAAVHGNAQGPAEL